MPRPGLDGDTWLTSREAAEILFVSGKTLQRWAQEGKVPYQATLGGHRRYSERAMRALREAQTYRPEGMPR